MTTTDMFQGLEGGKNSSRVLRPPGGASSNIFGGDAVPEYRKTVTIQQTETTDEDNRAAGVRNPKDNATSHNRLFGQEEGGDKSMGSPVIEQDMSAPAGVSSGSTKKKNQVTTDSEENDTSTGITACRKRIFRNEGRDEEEEDEEERKKREEEEARQKELEEERSRVRNIAKPPRGAYNPITGEDYSDQPKAPQSGRMRQPPGGASSGLW